MLEKLRVPVLLFCVTIPIALIGCIDTTLPESETSPSTSSEPETGRTSTSTITPDTAVTATPDSSSAKEAPPPGLFYAPELSSSGSLPNPLYPGGKKPPSASVPTPAPRIPITPEEKKAVEYLTKQLGIPCGNLAVENHVRSPSGSYRTIPLTAEQAEVLADLPNLKRLGLTYSTITDDTLRHIAVMKDMENLNLSECKGITDEGMKHLSTLENLEFLDLTGTAISSKGFSQIQAPQKLKGLQIGQCPNIDDDAVDHIIKFKNLTLINLYQTKVSEAGKKRIREALPKASIP